jgi:hypothetical protein
MEAEARIDLPERLEQFALTFVDIAKEAIGIVKT